MEKYDYRNAICEDIREYIREHSEIVVTEETRDELQDSLHDDLWVEDSVTGNASGSYTFNAWQAEEYLCHNTDLLLDALSEFGANESMYIECLESAKTADVTIRCYLLSECISSVLDELVTEVDNNDDEYEED